MKPSDAYPWESPPVMRLRAIGGLCNRLRAILSRPRPLTIIWPPDVMVDFGRFGDVFQPLPGVTFIDDGPADEEAFAPPPDVSPGWEAAFRELRLTARAQGWLDSARPRHPYAAIHVRRTDHAPLARAAGAYTPDEDFFHFVEMLPAAMPVYVATDNRETQERWRRALDDRAWSAAGVRESTEAQGGTDHRRHTSLEHAAVDLFACAGAGRFLGSGYSTFTETIQVLRRLEGRS